MTNLMLISLGVLIILSGFFSGVETAFVALGRLRLQHMVEKRGSDKNTQLVKKLKDNSHKLISTLLIGNNLVNIGASAIATSLAIGYFGDKGVGIATGVMTFIVLIFGEITPKTIAITNAEKICLAVAKPIYWLSIIFTPLIWVLDLLTKGITRYFHRKAGSRPLVTEEEIKSFVRIGEEIGSIEKDEKEMINNIFKLNDIEVKDIMTPKIHIKGYEELTRLGKVKQEIVSSRYSRIPLYRKNIDRITGMLYIKDVMRAIAEGKDDIKLAEIARKPFFIPLTKKADNLLKDFQRMKVHVAIVVDEYGVSVGIVSIEDLLEEIVGEIYDETDLVKDNIHKKSKDVYEIDGDTPLEDIRRQTKINIKNGAEVCTIAGIVMDKIGRIPLVGDKIKTNGWTIEVLSMQEQRIGKVRLSKR